MADVKHWQVGLVAVTASQTVAVAQSCAPAVKRGVWFLAKQRAAKLIDAAGGSN